MLIIHFSVRVVEISYPLASHSRCAVIDGQNAVVILRPGSLSLLLLYSTNHRSKPQIELRLLLKNQALDSSYKNWFEPPEVNETFITEMKLSKFDVPSGEATNFGIDEANSNPISGVTAISFPLPSIPHPYW